MRKPPENRRALPIDSWPERDRLAWLEATKAGDDDLLAVERPALRWRASSKEVYVRYYGIWLAWKKDQNLLDPNAAPGERVTRAGLAAFLRAQRALGNSAKTLVNQAVSLKSMFEALSPGAGLDVDAAHDQQAQDGGQTGQEPLGLALNQRIV
jgi:hypothetical protein